jgi:hypothetical protein
MTIIQAAAEEEEKEQDGRQSVKKSNSNSNRSRIGVLSKSKSKSKTATATATASLTKPLPSSYSSSYSSSSSSFKSSTTFKNEQQQQEQKQKQKQSSIRRSSSSSSSRRPSSTDSVTRGSMNHNIYRNDSKINIYDSVPSSRSSNGSNLLLSSSSAQYSVEEQTSSDLKDFDEHQIRLSQLNNPYQQSQSQKQQQQQQRSGRPGIRLLRSKSQVFLPRLVNRNMPFHQSQNRIAVFNLNWKQRIYKLLVRDWFHVLLRVHILLACLVLIIIWTVAILIWAFIYILSDNYGENLDLDCGLGKAGNPLSFAAAFAFAMETATTVGYGLPSGSNGFFEKNCGHIQTPIYFQMVFNMLFNAFMFAFFYSQLSKSETRSIQLVFSNKLIIGVKDNQVYASVRCYDLDSANPLVEAHARMYLLDHKLKLKPLRIVDPDDDNGAFMHLSIPQEITHEVDHHSALSPRSMPLQREKNSTRLNLRSVDSITGSRDEIHCPVCGESFATYPLLQAHCDFNKMIEDREDYPMASSHRSFVMPDITPISLYEVQQHVEQTLSEIVVVVEAIDPQLSGTFQALQSYKYDNIEFAADFEHCMTVQDNKIAVDMDKFHNIKYKDENSFYDCIESDEGNDHDDDDEKTEYQRQIQFQHHQEEEETLAKILEDNSNDDDDDDGNIDKNNSSSNAFSSWRNHVPVELLTPSSSTSSKHQSA